jgi:hypothetical protein
VTTRIAVAFAWGCLVSVLFYALVRAVQWILFREPNPALVVWTPHAGYFWRVWTVAFAGVLASLSAFLVTSSSVERAARALLPMLAVAAVLLALQAAFMP